MKFVIIGNGAAAFASLIRANELGVKPIMIGYGKIGGTCVNVGCVPSKRLLRIGETYKIASKVLGEDIFPDFFKTFNDKKDIVNALRKEKYEDVLSSYDVTYIEGKAHFISPKAVKVNDKIIEGDKFLIATGSSPFIPEIKGLREVGFWTNVEALSPDRKISSLAVIGGRAQALEFAQIYKRLGVDVIILQRSKRLLPNWEPEISLAVQAYLSEEEGIYIVTDVNIKEVKKGSEGKLIITDKGEVEVDEILIATGRKPNTDLNLDVANVKVNNKGGVFVNDELRTTNPDIFAAGDVIGREMLEAVAGKEGAVATENALLNARKTIDRISIPQVVFIEPNVAKVGLTYNEAIQQGYNADYRIVKMNTVAKARILGTPQGLIKMNIDKDSKRIIGVHIFGQNASEVINEGALAIKLGASIDDIIDTIHVFPTMSESLKLVSMAFYRNVEKMSCCVD